MRATLTKLLAAMLAVLMPLLTIPPVTASAAYENTHGNTGNQRKDIVSVALTQIGYREGSNNDTKYCDWYGMPNQPWCAIFVSWCANQAGISNSIIKKNARAHPAYFGLSAKSGSSYTPRSGDLFFCKRNGAYAHAGIVYYVDGDYFYTIEGNANNGGSYDGIGVFSLRRKISACYFSSPAYLGNEDCTYAQGYETTHPHKSYYKCTNCSDRYYTEEYGTLESCQTCIMENCNHQYGSWEETNSGHRKVCYICTKEETSSHSWSVKVLQKADCTQSGLQEKTCKVCGAFVSQTLPQSTNHSYGAWKQVDEESHSRSCSVCEKSQTSAHTLQEEWDSDAQGHYKVCSGCGWKDETVAHDFSENCEAGCLECGYISENIHSFASQWSSDEESHWYVCQNCAQIGSHGAHSFDNSCDTQCNDCDYKRQTTHSFGEQWLNDETWHWMECTVCGYKKDHAKHAADSSLMDASCEQCGYLVKHVHQFDFMQQNQDEHWGMCLCGQEDARQVHQWTESDICPVCQTKKPTPIWFWILVIGGPVLLAGGGISTAILLSRRKKGLYA